ncbi:MAG: STAS domain-containing protein [Gemmatimonadaceae bacterium]
MTPATRLDAFLATNESGLLAAWLEQQAQAVGARRRLISESELRDQSRELLGLLRQGLQEGGGSDMGSPAWRPMRDLIASISRSRALQGFSPSETAMFVFSLKRPVFDLLRRQRGDSDTLGADLIEASELLDRLGLYATEVFQQAREEVIARQQQDMLELSTPVVKLWEGVLALPMIGTLDSARTQVVMETLLQRIVETGAELAIIDITGVPTVDTLVAQHLLKTVTAARLMGADCIISGIRPQIAQTIVHLGVDLSMVTTKATLADAFRLALQRSGVRLAKAAPHGGAADRGV